MGLRLILQMKQSNYRKKMSDRDISRNDDVNWLTNSCNFLAFDYFMWSYTNSYVYKSNSQLIFGV